MKFLSKKEDGFVALFTVLLVSVILAMALGIASISLKEIVLSSSASEGSKAFYAADSGIECGLFLERGGSLSGGSFFGLTCNGFPLAISDYSGPEAAEIFEFDVPFGDENSELCASVIIRRGVIGPFPYNTSIESKGSNLPCTTDLMNPKRVERSVRVTY